MRLFQPPKPLAVLLSEHPIATSSWCETRNTWNYAGEKAFCSWGLGVWGVQGVGFWGSRGGMRESRDRRIASSGQRSPAARAPLS